MPVLRPWPSLFVIPVWVLCTVPGALGAQVEHLTVERSGEDYNVSLRAVLDAPLDQVWSVLTDYARFHEVSPAIKESEILEQRDAHTHRVRTRAAACVLIFCKETEQVQTMHQQAPGRLAVEVDPAHSDFEFGRARWYLEAASDVTHLQFEARIRPAVWVPPVIGPWVVQRVLHEEARATTDGLERLARERLP